MNKTNCLSAQVLSAKYLLKVLKNVTDKNVKGKFMVWRGGEDGKKAEGMP
jgi:hypothetical protein